VVQLSVFRRGNEVIARNAERAGFTEQHISFICECADESCFEPVALTLEEYRLGRDTEGSVVVIGHHVASI
jgi:hypothetical protein